MKLFLDKSILTIIIASAIAIAFSVACVCAVVSPNTTTYLLGRTRISYVVPITPIPTCSTETRIGKFTYINCQN